MMTFAIVTVGVCVVLSFALTCCDNTPEHY